MARRLMFAQTCCVLFAVAQVGWQSPSWGAGAVQGPGARAIEKATRLLVLYAPAASAEAECVEWHQDSTLARAAVDSAQLPKQQDAEGFTPGSGSPAAAATAFFNRRRNGLPATLKSARAVAVALNVTACVAVLDPNDAAAWLALSNIAAVVAEASGGLVEFHSAIGVCDGGGATSPAGERGDGATSLEAAAAPDDDELCRAIAVANGSELAHSSAFAEAAVAAQPRSARAMAGLVRALERERSFQRAAQVRGRLERLMDSSGSAADGAGESLNSAEWEELGKVMQQELGRPEMAFEALRNAIRLSPGRVPASASAGTALLVAAGLTGRQRELRREFARPPPPARTSVGQCRAPADPTVATASEADRACARTPGGAPPPTFFTDVLQAYSDDALRPGRALPGVCGHDGLRHRAAAFLAQPEHAGQLQRLGALRQEVARHLRTERGRAACDVVATADPTMLWHYFVSALSSTASADRDDGALAGAWQSLRRRRRQRSGARAKAAPLVVGEALKVDLIRGIVHTWAAVAPGVPPIPFAAQAWNDGEFPIQVLTIARSICDVAARRPRGNATEQVLASVHAFDAAGLRVVLRREARAHAAEAAANARDAAGFTALHHALAHLDEPSFAVLLEGGADPCAESELFGARVADLVVPSADGWGRQRTAFCQLVFGDAAAECTAAPPNASTLGESRGNSVPAGGHGWDDGHADAVALPGTLRDNTAPGVALTRGVPSVDARSASIADVVERFVATGTPVLITHAMDGCEEQMRQQWSRKSVLDSDFAVLNFSAFRVPFGEGGENDVGHVTVRDFIEAHLGASVRLSNSSEPRYIFSSAAKAHASARAGAGPLPLAASVSPVTETLACIPWDLQEYFNLPPPFLPGSWAQWTVGIGGAGSGTPHHMHLRAVNVLVVGTKRWFLRPPARSTYSTRPVFEWLRQDDPHGGARQGGNAADLVEFTQRPGEIVVLPAWVNHATVCVGDCVAFAKVLERPASPTVANPPGPLQESTFSTAEHATLRLAAAGRGLLPLVPSGAAPASA